jgi:hypothetical protein
MILTNIKKLDIFSKLEQRLLFHSATMILGSLVDFSVLSDRPTALGVTEK